MAISSVKKKRVSKKNKLAWRKHTKVQDVEEFLDEQRQEERLGPIETISNEQLFIVDTKPKDEAIYSRQRRKLRATRPLKGFSALEPSTNVPDPNKKRNRVRQPEERKSELVKKKEQENRQKGVLKAKEINAIAERRLDEIKREKKEKRGEFVQDVWSDETNFAIQKDPWAETVTKVHNLRNTGVPVKRIVNDIVQKKSPLPAVEAPHPGMSYNPAFKDHQDLLRIVAAKEMKIIKEDEHLTRVTRNMFRKVTPDQKQNEWIVEMSEGIPSKKNEEVKVKEDPDEDLDRISINPPVKNKKKTLQQRRKQREQMALEKQLKERKTEKKKVGDIHLIKIVKKNLEEMDKKQEKLRKIRKIRAEKKKLLPKVLSATKYEDLGEEFQLGEDISGNLRNLKKEGNLLSDRFKSLQKRNILEPRKRAHKKKPKIKKFVKPGHRDDWEKTIARTSSLIKNKTK